MHWGYFSTDMVYYFYAVMKQAQQLSTSQPFFELYKLFKKYGKKYAGVLDSKLQRLDFELLGLLSACMVALMREILMHSVWEAEA